MYRTSFIFRAPMPLPECSDERDKPASERPDQGSVIPLRFPSEQAPEFIRNVTVHMFDLLRRENIPPFVDPTQPAVVVDGRLLCQCHAIGLCLQ